MMVSKRRYTKSENDIGDPTEGEEREAAQQLAQVKHQIDAEKEICNLNDMIVDDEHQPITATYFAFEMYEGMQSPITGDFRRS